MAYELIGRNFKQGSVYIVTVNAVHVADPGGCPNANPCTHTAAHIKYRMGIGDFLDYGYNYTGRRGRHAALIGIEAVVI
ncbi:hypothetical protein MKUB_21680 [Mycobacterium kubicae]|uniref:SWIM-type domain-containing protein n=1 Tax=Mycobacterium kubicae TaxID=120959 RepID=A0ABQ1BLT6_9MYCO|nr:hypothetical protein MKUB_21680 [Mycobacterium kubicae]